MRFNNTNLQSKEAKRAVKRKRNRKRKVLLKERRKAESAVKRGTGSGKCR